MQTINFMMEKKDWVKTKIFLIKYQISKYFSILKNQKKVSIFRK